MKKIKRTRKGMNEKPSIDLYKVSQNKLQNLNTANLPSLNHFVLSILFDVKQH